MLALTPDVERALEWFRWTHSPTDYGWQRTALPRRGGLAEQDARTMLLLDIIRGHANELQRERAEDDRKRRDVRRWRDARAEHLR